MHEIRTVLSCRCGIFKFLIDLIYLFCHFKGYMYLKNIEKIVTGKPGLYTVVHQKYDCFFSFYFQHLQTWP